MWTFKLRDKSKKQRFFNTVIVTFLPIQSSSEFYSPPGPNSLPVMPDVNSTQDVLYPFKYTSALLLSLGLVLLPF